LSHPFVAGCAVFVFEAQIAFRALPAALSLCCLLALFNVDVGIRRIGRSFIEITAQQLDSKNELFSVNNGSYET